MRSAKICFVAILCLAMSSIFNLSCEKGGGGGSTSAETTQTPVADQLAQASVTLANGDVAGARAAYDAIIGDGTAGKAMKLKATEVPDLAKTGAHFGRALCDIILLIEKDPATAMLAGFGQAPWKASNVFGANGYFAQTLTSPATARARFCKLLDLRSRSLQICGQRRHRADDLAADSG
ncbi:MAG: hypothetical protein V2A66_05855 [Pseudomonadota bacterium]